MFQVLGNAQLGTGQKLEGGGGGGGVFFLAYQGSEEGGVGKGGRYRGSPDT